MLPLVQMPSHAVTPPQSNLNPIAAYRKNDPSYTNELHPQDLNFPHQRSIPIRTCQPQQRTDPSNSLLHPLHSEHHLRRKTPNGTIDAGYDATPSHYSHGPRPSKHLVLPASVTAIAFPPAFPSMYPPPYTPNLDLHHPSTPGNVGLDDVGRSNRPDSLAWPFGNDMQLRPGPYP